MIGTIELFYVANAAERSIQPCSYRSKVGMVFQSFNLLNNMTVTHEMAFGNPQRQETPDFLARFGNG